MEASKFFLSHFPWLPSLSHSVTFLSLYFCLFISPFISPPPIFVSESLSVCSYVFVCLCVPLSLTLRLILSVCIYLTVSPYSLYLISSFSSSSPSTPFRRLYYPMLTDAPELYGNNAVYIPAVLLALSNSTYPLYTSACTHPFRQYCVLRTNMQKCK